ncbi:hypothetical protein HAX54_034114, partial [Datura stramonium]|nr:hypothetical protein [Datura stramonium]
MGGLCSKRATAESTTDGGIPYVNGYLDYGAGIDQSHRFPTQSNSDPMQSPAGESIDKQLTGPALSFPEANAISHGVPMDDVDDGIPRLSRTLSNKSRSTRSKQVAIAK